MIKQLFVRSIFLSVFMLATGSGASAEQYKFGHYFPSEDFRGVTATKFAEFAKKASPNFDITIYPSESLVKGRDALQATSRGTVDLYSVFAGYITGSVGLMKIFTVPFPSAKYDDARMMSFANDPKIIEILDKPLNKSNVKLLGFINSSGLTPMFFRTPFTKLADVKGRKIRGVGGYADTALKDMGASIVFMSAAEQFVQLETGGVDGVITTTSSYINQGMPSVAPYATADTVVRGPYALLMNKRKWDKLSDKDRVALMSAVKETIAWSNENFAKEQNKLNKEVEQKSKSIYKFTDADWSLANEEREKMMKEFVVENGSDAKEILAIYKTHQ